MGGLIERCIYNIIGIIFLISGRLSIVRGRIKPYCATMCHKKWHNLSHLYYTYRMSLSYEIEHNITEALKQLNNEFALSYSILKNCTIEELEALHKYARISMIGASTRIENALLTDSEVNWLDTILTKDGKPTALQEHDALIKNKLSKDRERSIEEVAGCRAMLMLIYENSKDFTPIKEMDIRALHYELLSPYKKAKKYAGKYKTQTNSVVEANKETGKSRIVFETADPGPITNISMNELVGWYNSEQLISPWPIAVSCEYVFRFLAIHPFQDGNGRLGRGLFLLSLLNSSSEIIEFVSRYLPIDRFIEKHKEEYYFALNRCSGGKFRLDPKEYEIQHFLKFMIKVLMESIQGIKDLKFKFEKEKKLSKSAVVVLKCFRDFPEIRLTTSIIIEQTGLPRRTVIRGLNTLVASKMIQKYGEGAGTRYQITF